MLTLRCPPPILFNPVGREDTPWTGPLKLFKVFIFRLGNAESQLAYMLVYHMSAWTDFCPFLPRLFAFLRWPAWHHAKTDVLVRDLAELQYVESAVLHLCHLTTALLKGPFSWRLMHLQTLESKYVSWHLRGQLENWRPCNSECFFFVSFCAGCIETSGPERRVCLPYPQTSPSAATFPNVTDAERCVCWSCGFSGGSAHLLPGPLWNVLLAASGTPPLGPVCSGIPQSAWVRVAIRKHLLLGWSGGDAALLFLFFTSFPPLTEDVPERLSHRWISSITASQTEFRPISVYSTNPNTQCNVITDLWGEQRAQMDSGNK